MIRMVLKEGDHFRIVKENGDSWGTIPIFDGDRLLGYTSSSVTIAKESGYIHIYDENGDVKGSDFSFDIQRENDEKRRIKEENERNRLLQEQKKLNDRFEKDEYIPVSKKKSNNVKKSKNGVKEFFTTFIVYPLFGLILSPSLWIAFCHGLVNKDLRSSSPFVYLFVVILFLSLSGLSLFITFKFCKKSWIVIPLIIMAAIFYFTVV